MGERRLSTPTPVVELHNLQYTIDEQPLLTLDRWTVPPQRHSLIIGPSGCGKTTLLYLLSGLLSPTAGEIVVTGVALSGLTDSERNRFRAHNIGIVLHNPSLLPALTVINNLRLARYLAGLPQDEQRIGELLAELDIGDLAITRPHHLTPSEAQRVAIARALVNHPRLILADEPTLTLGDTHCQEVITLLKTAAKRHAATVLIASQDERLRGVFAEQLDLSLPDATQ